MVLLILLFLLLAVLLGLVLYARWNYGRLEALGIPVANLHWLLGSTHDMHLKANHLQDYEWFKKYGNVYGVYEGREAQMFVSDPELIRLIWVKDFDHFCNRRRMEMGDTYVNEFLDFQPLDKWKAVRTGITPMFASSRIKKMGQVMAETVQDFTQYLSEECAKGKGKFLKFNAYDELFHMTTDLMSRTVFGIKIDHRNNPDDYLTKSLKEFFGGSRDRSSFFHSLVLSFPFLTRFVPIFESNSAANIVKALKRVIDARRQSGMKTDDMINQIILLLDKVGTPEFNRLHVNETTIMAQALMFFMAGPDQYTTAMVFLLHHLALDSEIERRLHEELDAFALKHKGQFDQENMSELVYTNACIQEVLRLYPPFYRSERICTKDWEHNGLQIKKGVQVFLPLYAAGRNPEVFEEPEAFNPERWLPENKGNLHPYAFMSFGFGPRNCVAIKMSFAILTTMLFKFCTKYQFKRRSDTKVEWIKGSLLMLLYEPIYFDVVERA